MGWNGDGYLGYDGDRWCCLLWWTGWRHLSLGISLHLWEPNLEIHLPFCFLRVGMVPTPKPCIVCYSGSCDECGADVVRGQHFDQVREKLYCARCWEGRDGG